MAEHTFDGAVGTLGLAVRLRVKGCGHGQGDAKEGGESLPEGSCEARVSVSDEGGGNAEALACDGVDEKGCGFKGCDGVVGGAYLDHLGEPVNENNSIVVAVGACRHGREIQAHGLPRDRRDWQGVEETNGKLVGRFVYLARDTSGDILADVCAHTRPVVVPLQLLKCFVPPQMSGKGGVVSVLEKVTAEVTFGNA